jgi:large subunit ribosomal protein L33
MANFCLVETLGQLLSICAELSQESRSEGIIKMAKSNRREKVKLVSTAGTGYFYTLNKLKGKEKLLLKKYDPKVRKHVEFKESKLQK